MGPKNNVSNPAAQTLFEAGGTKVKKGMWTTGFCEDDSCCFTPTDSLGAVISSTEIGAPHPPQNPSLSRDEEPHRSQNAIWQLQKSANSLSQTSPFLRFNSSDRSKGNWLVRYTEYAMTTLKAVRGTRDLLPPETALWNRIEATARDVFARYNFGEIRTPVFEDTSLFARSVGEETDIVSKEMYTWEDRARAQSEKTQSLTLRPENTAGVVRAAIEHNLFESGQLQKLYYIGPQFRRERPQKGRYRQFSQIGAEVIGPVSSGSESPVRDAEVLEMLATLLDELGITGWTLEVNSVGSAADRSRYNDVLRAALADVAPKMCGDCQRRAVTNPLRVLDCKVPEDQPIIETLPKIGDSLGQDSKDHFAQVTAALDAAGVPYKLNQRLVRGLDYYTRTTFEFTEGRYEEG